MVLCQLIRVSSAVGVNAFTKLAKFNANTKCFSQIRQFSASSTLLTGKFSIEFAFYFFIFFEINIHRSQVENIQKSMNG